MIAGASILLSGSLADEAAPFQKWVAEVSAGKFTPAPHVRCVGRYTTPEYEAAIQRLIDQYEKKKAADREFFAGITGHRELPLLAAVREIMK